MEVVTTYELDFDTGKDIPTVEVRPTPLAARPGQWVRRARPQRPGALQPEPPAPTEGFGRLRPVPK